MNRDHNSLLARAEAQVRYNEEASDAIQVVAACVALVGILVACFFALHIA